MADLVTKPVATSIVFDTAHILELRADLENKTAEVENLTTGEMYTSGGGGGDSDYEVITATVHAGRVSEQMEFTGRFDGFSDIYACDAETAKPITRFTTENGLGQLSVVGKNGKAYISANTVDESGQFLPTEAISQVSGLPDDFIVSGITFTQDGYVELTNNSNLVILVVEAL